jgi:hypothetical protein
MKVIDSCKLERDTGKKPLTLFLTVPDTSPMAVQIGRRVVETPPFLSIEINHLVAAR